jgi:hypothetical protein
MCSIASSSWPSLKRAWAADLFYVPAKEARLFFAVVIDLFTAKWSIGQNGPISGAIW